MGALHPVPDRCAAPGGLWQSVQIGAQLGAQLHADEAALVLRAIDAVRKERAEEQRQEQPDARPNASPGVPEQPVRTSRRAWPSRADAVVDLAERSLAGDESVFGGDLCAIEVRFGREALDPSAFRAELEDGTHVPAETFRRLAVTARPTLKGMLWYG